MRCLVRSLASFTTLLVALAVRPEPQARWAHPGAGGKPASSIASFGRAGDKMLPVTDDANQPDQTKS